MNLNKVKGILFDLDDTLFDCTGQLTHSARQRAAQTIVTKEPTLAVADLIQAQETLSQTLGSGGALQEIGHQHNLSEALIKSAREAYNRDVAEDITPFPDTLKTLTELEKRGYKLTLVTSGRPNRQRRKVDQLNLNHFFNEKSGTLHLHDDHINPDKTPYLQQAAQQLNLPPENLLAVGDKLTAEISAANTLGMITARIRHGRQKDRVPQTPSEKPHFEIDTLSELLTYLP